MVVYEGGLSDDVEWGREKKWLTQPLPTPMIVHEWRYSVGRLRVGLQIDATASFGVSLFLVRRKADCLTLLATGRAVTRIFLRVFVLAISDDM